MTLCLFFQTLLSRVHIRPLKSTKPLADLYNQMVQAREKLANVAILKKGFDKLVENPDSDVRPTFTFKYIPQGIRVEKG